MMSKKERARITFETSDEYDEACEAQERICYMVRRIWCLPLLNKAEDFMRRIYRRGSR